MGAPPVDETVATGALHILTAVRSRVHDPGVPEAWVAGPIPTRYHRTRCDGEARRSAALLDRHQLDLEDERGVRADVGACAAFAVREGRRDEYLPLRSDRHELEHLGPALDDALHRERGRLAAFVGAVELLPVDERAAVLADDGLSRGRLPARCPLVITLYCRPLGSVTTPSFALLAARNASPSVLFFSPAALASAACLASIAFCSSAMTAFGLLSGQSVLPPASASLRPAREHVRVDRHRPAPSAGCPRSIPIA